MTDRFECETNHRQTLSVGSFNNGCFGRIKNYFYNFHSAITKHMEDWKPLGG